MTDEQIVSFARIYRIAERYYSGKTFLHALRVSKETDNFVNDESDLKYLLLVLALSHDLLEDTDVKIDDLASCIPVKYRQSFCDSLLLLTRKPADNYMDYIRKIVESKNYLAILVKSADIIDLYRERGTLSNSLKKRYDKAREIWPIKIEHFVSVQ